MNVQRTLNRFLAGILVVIYHVFVGSFVPRSSLAYIVSMYIFVLVMIYIIGLPVDEETGEIQDNDVDISPEIKLGRNP